MFFSIGSSAITSNGTFQAFSVYLDVGAEVHLDDIVILEDRGVPGVGRVVGGHVVPAKDLKGLAAITPCFQTLYCWISGLNCYKLTATNS